MTEIPYRAGALIGDKYRVERIIGEGGMGVVVKATHLLLDEPVALKFLLPAHAAHPESSARFLREAKAALRIRSEHVARMLDVGRLDDGAPFIVMEYLEGRDLHESLALGPLAPTAAVDAVVQACVALDEAHRRGVIHRDIKPANLFLTEGSDGHPLIKVLDFGISKLTEEGARVLTATTATMGSAVYMSPEQLVSSRDVDERTDIYALGVTLFELLTARFPYSGDSMPQLVAAVLKGRAMPIASIRPDLSPDLGAIVHRAFAFAPEDRYASAADLAKALLPFASDHARHKASRLGAPPTLARPSTPDASPPALATVSPALDTEPPETPTAVAAFAEQERPGGATGTAPYVAPLPLEPVPAQPPIPTAAALTRSNLSFIPPARRRGLLAIVAVGGALALGGLIVGLSGDPDDGSVATAPEAAPTPPEPTASLSVADAPSSASPSSSSPAASASVAAQPTATAAATDSDRPRARVRARRRWIPPPRSRDDLYEKRK